MTMAPEITVVIPVYNGADTIDRAITSALTQEGVELELLVVDDASTDATPARVHARAADPRLRLLRHGHNQGGSAARNTGIGAARGLFVAFLDADDEWLPNRLNATLSVLRSRQAGFAIGAFRLVESDRPRDPLIIPRLPTSGVDARLLAAPPLGAGSTLVVRGELLTTIGGFDTTLPRHQDWDAVIRLCEQSVGVVIKDDLVRVHRSARPRYQTVMDAKRRFLAKHTQHLDALPPQARRRVLATHEIDRARFAWYEHRYFRTLLHIYLSARHHPGPAVALLCRREQGQAISPRS